jgi:hypothetical protein
MLAVPADAEFATFVTSLRKQGQSPASIASALSESKWADPSGIRWNWRQVETLCWSVEDCLSAPRNDGGREGCDFHRLQSLLRSLLTWSPFDAESLKLIARLNVDGASVATITARLNRSGLRPPAGNVWVAPTVRVLIRLGDSVAIAVEEIDTTGADSDTTDFDHDTFSPLAA